MEIIEHNKNGKRKNTVFVAFTLFALVLTIVTTTMGMISVDGTASVNVSPEVTISSPGAKFVINITIEPNSCEVYAGQFNLYYNATVLETINITQGPFLNRDNASTQVIKNEINNTIGRIRYAETRKETHEGVTEPGTFASILFVVKDTAEIGNTSLDLGTVKLSDPNETSISLVVNGGIVMIEEAPPNITPYAPPSPVNDTVCNWRTFNVTANQEVNVSWYLNESLLFTNESTTEANCTMHAEVVGEHNVSAIATNENGMDMQTWNWNVMPAGVFDTGSPVNPYPSIFGNYTGTIMPNQTITVHKLYTYPCTGTGGHTEYVRIWNDAWAGKEAYWNGYQCDWHNVTFDETFTLFAEKTYYYEIRTGSYPQIIHKPEHTTLDGSFINCTSFVDANGHTYNDWIPAIRLWA
jgi:hypothetical protein